MLGKVAEICVRHSNSQSGMNNSYGLFIFMCDDIHMIMLINNDMHINLLLLTFVLRGIAIGLCRF